VVGVAEVGDEQARPTEVGLGIAQHGGEARAVLSALLLVAAGGARQILDAGRLGGEWREAGARCLGREADLLEEGEHDAGFLGGSVGALGDVLDRDEDVVVMVGGLLGAARRDAAVGDVDERLATARVCSGVG